MRIIQPTTGRNEIEITELKEEIEEISSYERVLESYHYKSLWTYIVNGILGLWLVLGPYLFDYKSAPLIISDTVSGALIIFFEFLAFSPRRASTRWCTVAVGLWLLFAPLIFWSPTPAVYLLDTIVACLVISFSILIPGTPGSGGIELSGPDQPPGWTYNPSSWIRRWLGIALALLGFFISRYLAAHQLGYIGHAWDPFFGSGTDKVTGSNVSRSFPISDAGFGAVAYVMEVLTGFMGNRARWRTAPFVVAMFAVLVIPLGVTSIVLVIMQPVVVGAWCGLCLISAAALLLSVPLAVHETIAAGQFLLTAKRQKKSLWQVFWFGGTITGAGACDPDRRHYSFTQRWIASVQGVTVPLAIGVQLLIGLWLMSMPDILSFNGRAADFNHLFGALVVTVATVAIAEVTRIARFINMILGLILVITAYPFFSHFHVVFFSNLICGLALIKVSLSKGLIVERYAGWDKYIK
jgi:hypothetical protein